MTSGKLINGNRLSAEWWSILVVVFFSVFGGVYVVGGLSTDVLDNKAAVTQIEPMMSRLQLVSDSNKRLKRKQETYASSLNKLLLARERADVEIRHIQEEVQELKQNVREVMVDQKEVLKILIKMSR